MSTETEITISTDKNTGTLTAQVGSGNLYIAPRAHRMADLPTLPDALARIAYVWEGETGGLDRIAEWTQLVTDHPLGALALQIAAADTLG